MKQLILLVALLAGTGTPLQAADYISRAGITSTICDFVPIDLKDLPDAVRRTIEREFPDCTIQEAAAEVNEDGSTNYEIVLLDPDGMQKTVFVNDTGKLIG